MSSALRSVCSGSLAALVVDLAGGTGHYLAGVLDALPRRLAVTYGDYSRSGVTSVNYQLSLDHADLTALVSMGPSARHIPPQVLVARVRSLPSPFTVTVDLQIRVFARRRGPRLVGAMPVDNGMLGRRASGGDR